jgi:Nif-specific regulatory protein
MNEQVLPRQYRHVAEKLLHAAESLGYAPEPAIGVQRLLEVLHNGLGMQRCYVLLAGADSARLELRYDIGAAKLLSGHDAQALEKTLDYVRGTKEVAVIADAAASGTTAPRAETVVAPIIADGQVLGVLVGEAPAQCKRASHVHIWCCQMAASLLGQPLARLGSAESGDIVPELAAGDACSSADAQVYGILGRSPELQGAIHKALRAAQSQATVLITGESGCGKERFARMVHLASERRDHPFVCLNCAAIPKDLLESELFGHERGSFTGALADRVGKFELASRGTLFLDEIADMDIELQAKLLRVLQEKTVERIGGVREVSVDVRILAATNQNLEERVNENRFRLDLFFRLNVLRVQLPPLRERRGDVRLLALYFLTRENQRYSRNVVLSSDALAVLESYAWPGNVRQLENVMERLVLMAEREVVLADDMEALLAMEADIQLGAGEPPVRRLAVPAYAGAMDSGANGARPYQRVSDAERQDIEAALRGARGNKTFAARQLGLTPRQLYYRMAKLGLR